MGCHFSKNSLLPARFKRTRRSHISRFSDSDLEEDEVEKPVQTIPNQVEKPESPKAENETANSGVHEFITEEQMGGSSNNVKKPKGPKGRKGDGNKQKPESQQDDGEHNANSKAQNTSPDDHGESSDEKPKQAVEKPETSTLVEVNNPYTNYYDQSYTKQIHFSNNVMGQSGIMYMFSDDNPNACYIM